MAHTPANKRYTSAAVWLHWLMFALIAATFAAIELRVLFEKGTEAREAIKALHFMLGLSVLLLVSLRVYTRLTNKVPPIEPEPPGWQSLLAGLVHFTLYAWMVAMPILGWLVLSGEGKPIPFFGLELPPLIGKDKDLAKTLEGIHEWLGVAGYWIIGLHALAGLFHHYILHDNTLTRISLFRR
jgi:cytochrome b561